MRVRGEGIADLEGSRNWCKVLRIPLACAFARWRVSPDKIFDIQI